MGKKIEVRQGKSHTTQDNVPYILSGSLGKQESFIVPSMVNNVIICQEPVLLLYPWQIDSDYINCIITPVTRCEINHNMKTSNHWSCISHGCILLEEENMLVTWRLQRRGLHVWQIFLSRSYEIQHQHWNSFWRGLLLHSETAGMPSAIRILAVKLQK